MLNSNFRAYGVRRLAACMECRTFGAQALERLAFVMGSMQQALEYRSAVVILKGEKVFAQGFQRAVAPLRALSQVAIAQPARARCPVAAEASGRLHVATRLRKIWCEKRALHFGKKVGHGSHAQHFTTIRARWRLSLCSMPACTRNLCWWTELRL